MTALSSIAAMVRDSRGVRHKADIAAIVAQLGLGGGDAVPVGDDCAAIPDGDGHLLFAMEGFVSDFVAADPWFAGYCAVMVNLSDIAAMGGVAIALVNALWSGSPEQASEMLNGMRAASDRYGVPIVGGHSNMRARDGQLAAAIVGRAASPITSFDAQPGDALIVATDLRGRFRDPFPWWDASTQAPAERLRGDMALLPGLAADALVTAGKDISMAGVIGTAMMLAETSGVGMRIGIDRLPMPEGVDLARWLTAFPSFGFVLTVSPRRAGEVLGRFRDRGIAAVVVGEVTADRRLFIERKAEQALVWDFTHAFIGCARPQELAHA